MGFMHRYNEWSTVSLFVFSMGEKYRAKKPTGREDRQLRDKIPIAGKGHAQAYFVELCSVSPNFEAQPDTVVLL